MGSWKDVGGFQGSPLLCKEGGLNPRSVLLPLLCKEGGLNPRSVLLPLLCKEGRGEVEDSTPPDLPLQRGGDGAVVAPLTRGRKLNGSQTKA